MNTICYYFLSSKKIGKLSLMISSFIVMANVLLNDIFIILVKLIAFGICIDLVVKHFCFKMFFVI